MRNYLLAAAPALLLAACSLSPSDQCRASLEAQCDKLFECIPEADRGTDWTTVYGNDPSECVAHFNDGYTIAGYAVPGAHCENVTTATACDGEDGSVFHPDQADACIDGISAVSCADFTSESYNDPAACDLVCQAS